MFVCLKGEVIAMWKTIAAVFPQLSPKVQIVLIVAIAVVAIAVALTVFVGVNRLIKALRPIAEALLKHGLDWDFGGVKVPRPSDQAPQPTTQPNENSSPN